MNRMWHVCAYYIHRLGLSCYRRQLVFYCRRASPDSAAPALPQDFEFRFIRAAELEALHYPGGWLKLPEARQWIERGDSEMLAAIRDGRICSYLWVERHIAHIDYLDLSAELPPGHVYISKVLVVPEWRRHGLARAMYQFFSFREPGVTAHSACVTENLPMHRLFSQLQWAPRLLMTTWKMSAFQRHLLEPIEEGARRRFCSRRGAAACLFADH